MGIRFHTAFETVAGGPAEPFAHPLRNGDREYAERSCPEPVDGFNGRSSWSSSGSKPSSSVLRPGQAGLDAGNGHPFRNSASSDGFQGCAQCATEPSAVCELERVSVAVQQQVSDARPHRFHPCTLQPLLRSRRHGRRNHHGNRCHCQRGKNKVCPNFM